MRTKRRAKAAAVAFFTGLALVAPLSRPAQAGDGGGVAAGIIGGTALGLLTFGAAAHAYGPPPPPLYGVEPADIGPEDVGPGYGGPAPCHEVMVESFDPYAEAYVQTPRRVCD